MKHPKYSGNAAVLPVIMGISEEKQVIMLILCMISLHIYCPVFVVGQIKQMEIYME